jgi:hypothetical protein
MRLLREADTRHLGVMGISMRRDIGKTAPLITHQRIRLGTAIAIKVPDRH